MSAVHPIFDALERDLHTHLAPAPAAQPAAAQPVNDEDDSQPTPMRADTRVRLYRGPAWIGFAGLVAAKFGQHGLASLALYITVAGALVVWTWPEPRA
jgi:hypothetical protein